MSSMQTVGPGAGTGMYRTVRYQPVPEYLAKVVITESLRRTVWSKSQRMMLLIQTENGSMNL